jgi:hypothetical protein
MTQVPVAGVSIETIMADPSFALGVKDYRAGRAPRDMAAKLDVGGSHDDYRAATNAQWNYERGRQWAVIAPVRLPLRLDGKLNPAAVKLFRDKDIR